MKAFYATAYGGLEVMKLGEVPDPEPKRSETLIRVRASSVNPVDWKVRAGQLKIFTGWRFPKILGADFAGVVEKPNGSLKQGDAVYGFVPIIMGKQGGHAEHLVLKTTSLRPVPEGLSFEEAASLPTAALTALNGLRQCGSISGKTVLVNGASGGVGHFVVQIAKARGAIVTGVCSARNAEYVTQLGADTVIDYASEDFTKKGKIYDVIFDAYGHLDFKAAAKALAPRAVYLSTLASPSLILRGLWGKIAGRKIIVANYRGKPEDYEELARLIREDGLRPTIGSSFALDEGADAFQTLERGGTRGKVVIRVS